MHTLRFRQRWNYSLNTKPTIFELVSTPWENEYELKDEVQGTEAYFFEGALSSARLEFQVLSSSCIFKGRQTGGNSAVQTVKVTRCLHGPPLKSGQLLRVAQRMDVGDTDPIGPWTQDMIYLISSIKTEKDLEGPAPDHPNDKVYRLSSRLRVDQEKAVLEALNRRDQLPITRLPIKPVQAGGQTLPVQEVFFHGTIPQAIEMMGSSSQSVVTLAARMLINRKDEATAAVLAAIESDLTKQFADDERSFVRLSHLISLLAALDENHPQRAAGKFVEKWISHFSPPPTKEEPKNIEQSLYKNRALAWLLQTIKHEELSGEFCARLIKLRDDSSEYWKDTFQDALDAADIEKIVKLREALSRAVKSHPLRIPCPKRQTRSDPIFPGLVKSEPVELHFSSDGKTLLAQCNDATFWQWNSITGELKSRLDLPIASARKDGRYLVCMTSEQKQSSGLDPIGLVKPASPYKVIDSETGAKVCEITLPAEVRFYWRNNHQAIAAAKDQFIIFDYLTGKILKGTKTNQDLHLDSGELTEDGSQIYAIDCGGRSDNITARTIDIETGNIVELGSCVQAATRGCTKGLIPGGKYFYIGTGAATYLFDRKTIKPVVHNEFEGSYCDIAGPPPRATHPILNPNGIA